MEVVVAWRDGRRRCPPGASVLSAYPESRPLHLLIVRGSGQTNSASGYPPSVVFG